MLTLNKVLLAASLAAFFSGTDAALAAEAQETPSSGAVCIAPVRLDQLYYVSPNQKFVDADTRFTFDFGGYRQATVKMEEALWVRDLPQDKKFLLSIRRNGKPYAAFRMDMSKYKGQNLCLSFGGYGEWDLIDQKSGWSWKAFGCTCP